MSDVYNGRLVADGEGNLLADEGERAGYPVAYEDGVFVFLSPDDLSHNERHEKNALQVAATVDESMVDKTNKDLVNVTKTENQHHFGTLEDDPHYDANSPTGTKMRFIPDAVASKATGHTEAYSNGGKDE